VTLQLPDRQVVTERVTELQGQDPLSAFDQLALGCQREVGGSDRPPIVESPMPTIRSQQGRKTHLVSLTLLGTLVVGAFVGLPLALFVHGLTRRPLVAVVAALLVLMMLVGGVVRGLRATTRTVPPHATQAADHVATMTTDEVTPATGGAPLSLADLMARDPQVVATDHRLVLES
jgi:hypothetical protein